DRFVLTAEIPGTELQDLEVTVADGVLNIKGERKSSAIDPEAFRRQERFQGNWQRSIPLPERIVTDEMSASLNDGILAITFPKAKQSQLRHIPVVSDD
ncbi:MAG: Hsp20/alpha crystallin family protein, partial [Planctomycetaceae bacterium]